MGSSTFFAWFAILFFSVAGIGIAGALNHYITSQITAYNQPEVKPIVKVPSQSKAATPLGSSGGVVMITEVIDESDGHSRDLYYEVKDVSGNALIVPGEVDNALGVLYLEVAAGNRAQWSSTVGYPYAAAQQWVTSTMRLRSSLRDWACFAGLIPAWIGR